MGVDLKQINCELLLQVGEEKALFRISRELQFGICNCGKSPAWQGGEWFISEKGEEGL